MIHLDAKLTPAPEMVILRELESASVSSGGFVLSEDALNNSRTGFFVVEAVGSIAANKTKLLKGDYVFADRLASHYHTEPVMVIKYDSILLLTNKDKGNLRAMPGWCLIKQEEDDPSKFIVDDSSQLRHGIVKSINYGDLSSEECPFAVGDDVLLTKQCDMYDGFAEGRFFAMKISEVIARFDSHDIG